MKKIALLITSILCFSLLGMAQAPEKVSYQSVVRDADNNLITGQEIGVQVSILQGSAEGAAVYTETQSPQTNANGLMSIKIGGGDTTDDFSAIDWSDGTYFLKVEVDPDGGANYSITAISQVLSVPYALHAKTFTGQEDMLARIEALEDALDNDNEDNGDEDGTVTDIDGNVYQTVIIGDQEWMAENLRVTRYSNGDDIPTDLSGDDWGNTTEGAYAIYDHNASNTGGINSPEEMDDAYGKLYNWYATNDERGLCPPGWQVPSDNDWTALHDYLLDNYPEHDEDNLGNAMKSCRRINSPLGGECDTEEHPRWDEDDWTGEDHYGSDDFGFGGLPAGSRHNSGFYYGIGMGGYWWSSSQNTPETAWYRGLFYNYGA